MSVQAMTWAAEQRPATPLEKLLLMRCADGADMDGFVSIPKDIAEFCCAHESEVEAAFDRLHDAGFIERVEGRSRLCMPIPRPTRTGWEPSKALRRRMIEAAGGKCVACGDTERLCIDHIVPRSKGGTNDEANLQILCARCNTSKRNRMPGDWKGRAQ